MRRIAIVFIALALAACQARLPLNRTEAAAAAQNWCVREGKAWGDPAEVKPAAAPDTQGRNWWTVRFPGSGGEQRVILVDADTGWAKRAP